MFSLLNLTLKQLKIFNIFIKKFLQLKVLSIFVLKRKNLENNSINSINSINNINNINNVNNNINSFEVSLSLKILFVNFFGEFFLNFTVDFSNGRKTNCALEWLQFRPKIFFYEFL